MITGRWVKVELSCFFELGPFSPMYFPLPRGKRYFFCGTKVVEIKKRVPLGRGKIHRGKCVFQIKRIVIKKNKK